MTLYIDLPTHFPHAQRYTERQLVRLGEGVESATGSSSAPGAISVTTTAFLAEYYYVMTAEVSFVFLLPSPHAPCRDLSVYGRLPLTS